MNYIKRKIAEFWEEHKDKDFETEIPKREVEEFLRRLAYDFPFDIIREALLELQVEALVEVEKARRCFYENLKEVSRKKINRAAA